MNAFRGADSGGLGSNGYGKVEVVRDVAPLTLRIPLCLEAGGQMSTH